jgi:hypothetical protein
MLLTIISNIFVPTTNSSGTISMFISPGLPQCGTIVTLGCIILWFLREILASSDLWNENLKNSFNLAIRPLLFTFAAILTYKIGAIIVTAMS